MGAYDNPTWQVDKSREILIKNMMNTMQTTFSTIEKKEEWKRQKKEKSDALLNSQIAVSDANFNTYSDNIESKVKKMGVSADTKDDFLNEVFFNVKKGKQKIADYFRDNPNLTDSERTEMMRIELKKVEKLSENIGFGKVNMDAFTAGTTDKKIGDPNRIYFHNDISRDMALILDEFKNGGAKAEWNEGENDWNYLSKDGKTIISGDDMKKFYSDGGFKTTKEIPGKTSLTKYITENILDPKVAGPAGFVTFTENKVTWDKDKIKKHLQEEQDQLFNIYRRGGEDYYQHIFSEGINDGTVKSEYDEKKLLFGEGGILEELMSKIPEESLISIKKDMDLNNI